MKKIKDFPLHERPREKLIEQGAITLADHELLAIILGKGSKKHDVLSLSKQLVELIDKQGAVLRINDILSIPGIGEAKATAIAAAFEFVRRRIKPTGLKIKFPVDVLPLIQHFSDRKQEYLLCISINGANEVMNIRVVTIGLVNKTQIHPREVFADVLAERASAIIIAHNHPEGDLHPTEEDFKATARIKEAADILGLAFLDHIIFNNKGYYSFVEQKPSNRLDEK